MRSGGWRSTGIGLERPSEGGLTETLRAAARSVQRCLAPGAAGAIYIELSNACIQIKDFAGAMGAFAVRRRIANADRVIGTGAFSVTERNGRYFGHGEPTVFAANA